LLFCGVKKNIALLFQVIRITALTSVEELDINRVFSSVGIYLLQLISIIVFTTQYSIF